MCALRSQASGIAGLCIKFGAAVWNRAAGAISLEMKYDVWTCASNWMLGLLWICRSANSKSWRVWGCIVKEQRAGWQQPGVTQCLHSTLASPALSCWCRLEKFISCCCCVFCCSQGKLAFGLWLVLHVFFCAESAACCALLSIAG